MPYRLVAALAGVLCLAGCASKVPVAVREPIPGSPGVAQVRQDPVAYLGERVRWGGTIVAVHNRQRHTRIEVVARELGGQGRPAREDATPGRFLARVGTFLDPAVYAEGRRITVAGTLIEPVTRPIGQFDYRFPVVRVEAHYLWPEEQPRRDPYPPPWYHDPWHPYYGPYPPYW